MSYHPSQDYDLNHASPAGSMGGESGYRTPDRSRGASAPHQPSLSAHSTGSVEGYDTGSAAQPASHHHEAVLHGGGGATPGPDMQNLKQRWGGISEAMKGVPCLSSVFAVGGSGGLHGCLNLADDVGHAQASAELLMQQAAATAQIDELVQGLLL